MATATSQAPTEGEIRAHVLAMLDYDSANDHTGTLIEVIGELIAEVAMPLTWPVSWREDASAQAERAPQPDESPWGALTASEAAALRDATQAAIRRTTDRCAAIIVEELTAGGLAFAVKHPDARRSEEAVPA